MFEIDLNILNTTGTSLYLSFFWRNDVFMLYNMKQYDIKVIWVHDECYESKNV